MCIVCVSACALLSRSLDTPRHRCVMMHEVVACKAILSLAPQFDTTLTKKSYNVTLGTPRHLNDYVKYVTIDRMCRSITIFQINGGAES